MRIGAPMPSFERGDIVRVPFPYTNRPIQQRRPALIVSTTDFSATSHLLWVVMITSAENRPWRGDVSLADDFARFGLPAPSVIRTAKIATIEAAHAERIGEVSAAILQQVDDNLRRHIGF